MPILLSFGQTLDTNSPSKAFFKVFLRAAIGLGMLGPNFGPELREQLSSDLSQHFGIQLRYLDKRLRCLTGFAAALFPLFQRAF